MRSAEDRGGGFQGLAIKRTGVLRCLAGTLASVDVNIPAHFRLPASFIPSFDSNFLVPVMTSEGGLMSATVSLSASAGHVSRVKIVSELRLASTATVSLGHAMFVPREVGHPTDLKLKTVWKITDHLTASYTKLDMGDGATMTLCVFAGAVTTSNPQGRTVPIATIDYKCIADYRGRAWFVPANMRVEGQQQWFSNEPGKTTGSEFQLTLVDGSTLALWQTKKLGGNQEVTVVLDGLVFSSGPRLPAGCRRSQAIGANSTCRPWCKRNKEPWSEKCNYKKSCVSCDECAKECDVTETGERQPIQTAANGMPTKHYTH